MKINRPSTSMRFRKLRIAWSVGCGILCVLLCALWMRSYWIDDRLVGPVFGADVLTIESVYGRTDLFYLGPVVRGPTSWTHVAGDAETMVELAPSWSMSVTAFHFEWSEERFVVFPHWFLIAFIAILSGLPWIRRSNRFTLRTLLIAITAIAVVLGLVVWSIR
jgi:hypothetical protein